VASAAALYSEINELSRRIRRGHELIDGLQPGDPRIRHWQSHLTALYKERRRMRNL
jgi:hypothetical protein